MDNKREIEGSGENVADAIAAGLKVLGVERDAVGVEVLDEGSRGLLGIGARPARVRLTVQIETVLQVPLQSAVEEAVQPEIPTAVETVDASIIVSSETEKEELNRLAPIASQALEELLEKMEISAHIDAHVRAPQDEEDYYKLILNIRGRDLGILIGRRGETLEALQYVARLIVGREVERRINLVVDVEGYRVRRERSLEQLANRMAERVVATGRRQVLEPMSAAERRVVHVALRNHEQVATESIGEADNRKVTIFLRGSK